jgi:hypothetical protein
MTVSPLALSKLVFISSSCSFTEKLNVSLCSRYSARGSFPEKWQILPEKVFRYAVCAFQPVRVIAFSNEIANCRQKENKGYQDPGECAGVICVYFFLHLISSVILPSWFLDIK